jgi:hypothetical protein
MVEKEDMLIFRLREQKRQAQPAIEHPSPVQVLNKEIQKENSKAKKPSREKTVSKQQKEVYENQQGQQNQQSQQKQQKGEPIFMIPTTSQYAVNEAEVMTGNSGGKLEMKSRDAALGQRCEWHPWRAAYAICDKCHKPYCYEDISEYNGRYYCLEDIDSATNAARSSIFVYNRIGDVSAAMLIIALPVLVYFASGSMSYLLSEMLKEGIQSFVYSNFISQINYGYLLLLGGFVLGILEFASGILIFGQSNKGYALGLISGFLSTVLFSYSYLLNSEIYAAAIAGISFIGMLLLAYSKNATLTEQQESKSVAPVEAIQYGWPNIGRF